MGDIEQNRRHEENGREARASAREDYRYLENHLRELDVRLRLMERWQAKLVGGSVVISAIVAVICSIIINKWF